MQRKKAVFIEWSKYNSRAASLSSKLDVEMFFIGEANVYKNPIRSLVSYIPKTIENLRLLRKRNPDIIIVTNTFWVIAAVNFLYAKIFNKELVFDSHSCAFDHSFLKYPLFLSKFFAKHSFLSLVTNESHHRILQDVGAACIILNDIPFEEEIFTERRIDLGGNFNICYVCTFAGDEPYDEVIKAGELIEDVQLFVTGNFEKASIDPGAYEKIKFLGFLPDEEYKMYLNSVDAIMTLTKREHTMQCAGSEAISVAKPLITSNTAMLRKTFHKGTVFVENNSESIVLGIKETRANYELYLREMEQLRQERKVIFPRTLNLIKEKLGL